ncbi:hypothetical protein NGA_2038000, partial [Nannochloropsis gaditana CCMP526]|uniref:uncharacterized protein n=1 Tax=Nannochloropsis gaditana (strain CCMP526) TaxID=1093141 RepID=UPI00029F752A
PLHRFHSAFHAPFPPSPSSPAPPPRPASGPPPRPPSAPVPDTNALAAAPTSTWLPGLSRTNPPASHAARAQRFGRPWPPPLHSPLPRPLPRRLPPRGGSELPLPGWPRRGGRAQPSGRAGARRGSSTGKDPPPTRPPARGRSPRPSSTRARGNCRCRRCRRASPGPR